MKITVIISISLLINLSIFTDLSEGRSNHSDGPDIQRVNRGSIEQDPIHIDGNAQLCETAREENWKGSGDAEDPFIIENLAIDGYGFEYGILIKHTNLTIKIRNCSISNVSRTVNWNKVGTGIFLEDVVGCTVNSNSILYSATVGISMTDVYDSSIISNEIRTYCQYEPCVYVRDSSNITFMTNRISGSSDGLVVYSSNGNRFINNNISLAYTSDDSSLNMRYSFNNSFINNSFGHHPIDLGDDMRTYRSNQFSNNTIGGRSMVFITDANHSSPPSRIATHSVHFVNISYMDISEFTDNVSFVCLVHCVNLTIENTVLNWGLTRYGRLSILSCENISIFNHTVVGVQGGTYLHIDRSERISMEGLNLASKKVEIRNSKFCILTKSEEIGHLILWRCNDIRVNSNTIDSGTIIKSSNRVTLDENELSGYYGAIEMEGNCNNITGNWIVGCARGILLSGSRNLISGNRIDNVDYGISLYGANSCEISGNSISSRSYDIIDSNDRRQVVNCTIFNNRMSFDEKASYYSIYFRDDSLDNKVYLNYIGSKVYDGSQSNRWNLSDGFGNYHTYWQGEEKDEDMIVDQPYSIPPWNVKDHHPIKFLISPPSNIKVDEHPDYIEMKWEEPIFDVCGAPYKYQIFKWSVESSENKVAELYGNEYRFVDPDVSNERIYHYSFRAFNEEDDPSPFSRLDVMFDFSDPLIEIICPKNGTIIGNNMIEAYWCVSDFLGTGKQEVLLDGLLLNDTPERRDIVLKNLTDGWHVLSINAEDLVGNNGSSSISFGVDTTPPEFRIISPPEGSYINSNVINIAWGDINDLSGIHHCEVKTTGNPWVEVRTGSMCQYVVHKGFVGEIFVKAIDMLGNERILTRRITVDITPPSVEITHPGNNDVILTRDVHLRFSIADETTDVVGVSVNMDGEEHLRMNGDLQQCSFNVDDGYHEIEVVAYDSANNVGMDQICLTVDYRPPEVSILHPIQGETVGGGKIEVSWKAENPGLGIFAIEITVDDNSMMVGNVNGKAIGPLDEGYHNLTVSAFDGANRCTSDNVRFFVDNSPPSVAYYSPKGSVGTDISRIEVRFSEEMDTDTLVLRTGGIRGGIVRLESKIFLIPSADLPIGESYRIMVEGSDIAGNRMTPFEWSFDIYIHRNVTGRVVDRYGNPMAGVNISWGEGEFTYSDRIGHFTIKLDSEVNSIVLYKEGYRIKTVNLEGNITGDLNIGDIEISEGQRENKGVPLHFILMIELSLILVLLITAAYLLTKMMRKGELEKNA